MLNHSSLVRDTHMFEDAWEISKCHFYASTEMKKHAVYKRHLMLGKTQSINAVPCCQDISGTRCVALKMDDIMIPTSGDHY